MICVSIAEPLFTDALRMASQYSFVELRLDAGNFSGQEIVQLVSASKGCIATCRPGKHREEQRMDMLIQAIRSGAAYVDIEFEAPDQYRKDLIREAVKHNCEVIISWHDFDRTPEKEELERILDQCYILGADIAKLASMVTGSADMARLLSLYSLPGRKVVLGMGLEGSFSRVAALMLGAEFSFATPGPGKETAPGQMTPQEMEAFWKRFMH